MQIVAKMLKPAFVIVLIFATSGLVGAQAAEVKGDLEYGQYLSAECLTCHSASGIDNGIPSITGWNETSFRFVLSAYKSKTLKNPTMQLIAGRLDQEQIASLALYFSSLPLPE
jgi:cytochrome c553